MNKNSAVVLVVEDTLILRMGAVRMVQAAGYETLEAEDADMAVQILESAKEIDLVFTDVQMPGTMDGVKLSHYIHGRWPLVKVIVSSGAAIPAESSLPEGCRFFAKPYRYRMVVDEMARMLSTDSQLPHGS